MMFHLFKRKESCKEVPIYAIANGTLADLEEVEDITFSEKLLEPFGIEAPAYQRWEGLPNERV